MAFYGPSYDPSAPAENQTVANVPGYEFRNPYDQPPPQDQSYDIPQTTIEQIAAPAPPPKDLASSPEWLTFLNSLGLDRSQFQADIARQRGVAQNLAGQQAADITAQGGETRRGITGNLESRGMARSGQLIRGLAVQRAAEGRAQGGVQANLTGTLSGLESQLAQKMLDLNQQQAQQELQLRSSGAYT